jgi:orotate phosphoribosyltransferase
MWSEDEVCRALLEAGTLTVRDVAAGEEPFLYSSGQRGPGYVMVKALVARQDVFLPLADALAAKLHRDGVPFDHIAGNATGGMIPAYAIRAAFQQQTGRHDIEYVYVRGSRKPGGFGELVTALEHIPPPRASVDPPSWLVVEDLVNYAETPVNTLLLLRSLGYRAEQAAAFVSFGQREADERLAAHGVTLTCLTTVGHLLDVAVSEGAVTAAAAEDYRSYLADPAGWQRAAGLTG